MWFSSGGGLGLWTRLSFLARLSVLLLGSIGGLEAQPRQSCLSYKPAVVHLTGILQSKTYPGPPNYESIRGGDTPETYWFLALFRPVCVNRDDTEPDLHLAHKGIRRIQLVFLDRKSYEADRKFLAERVVATGTLFGGVTAHHRTPVLLWVSAMAREK